MGVHMHPLDGAVRGALEHQAQHWGHPANKTNMWCNPGVTSLSMYPRAFDIITFRDVDDFPCSGLMVELDRLLRPGGYAFVTVSTPQGENLIKQVVSDFAWRTVLTSDVGSSKAFAILKPLTDTSAR